jgi:hypothetical protein
MQCKITKGFNYLMEINDMDILSEIFIPSKRISSEIEL